MTIHRRVITFVITPVRVFLSVLYLDCRSALCTFVRLPRSYAGLSLTAIAQHYESQSIYFAEPPAKVIETFRAQGLRIARDGTFPSTDFYAGITSTRGEGAAYGKSELGCGV